MTLEEIFRNTAINLFDEIQEGKHQFVSSVRYQKLIEETESRHNCPEVFISTIPDLISVSFSGHDMQHHFIETLSHDTIRLHNSNDSHSWIAIDPCEHNNTLILPSSEQNILDLAGLSNIPVIAVREDGRYFMTLHIDHQRENIEGYISHDIQSCIEAWSIKILFHPAFQKILSWMKWSVASEDKPIYQVCRTNKKKNEFMIILRQIIIPFHAQIRSILLNLLEGMDPWERIGHAQFVFSSPSAHERMKLERIWGEYKW